jgi:double-strand break repair protein MRE11
MPSEAALASIAGIDNVKVEKLVREFTAAQSLKILPQAPFVDSVHQFVDKDDKYAMDSLVKICLIENVKALMLQDVHDEVDMENAMDRQRAKQDAEFEASGGVGVTKKSKRRGKLLPRSLGWDSDLDGEWADNPAAWGPSEEEDEPVPAARRGKAAVVDSDDDASIVSAPAAKTTRKAPTKKAPAKPRAPAKAKAPAKATGRGRKKVAEPSDDEDDDLVMVEAPPPAKTQPKRAAATKGRQSVLNFSQSQAKPSITRELSDDEISDDDAFEPVVSSSRRR